MPSAFPVELSYLLPALAALEKFTPESLADDNEEDDEPLEIVEEALRSRVRGMDEESAYERLDEDHKLLGEWLEQAKPNSAPADFIHGMMGAWLMFGDIGGLTE